MIRVKMTLTHNIRKRTTTAWLGIKQGKVCATNKVGRGQNKVIVHFADTDTAESLLGSFKKSYNGTVDAEFIDTNEKDES